MVSCKRGPNYTYSTYILPYLALPGKTVEFYGREYHLRACDDFTRRHLLSEGISQKPEEDKHAKGEEEAGAEEASSLAAMPQVEEPREESKLRKFLENDGKVLR